MYFIINKNQVMDQFSKKIAIGKETRLFQFTRIENTNGEKFFITSHDLNAKAFSCSMKQTRYASDWKLIPGSQRWLYAIEENLSEAIMETRPN
jgi:hypothetical protein